jgi:hypothetical protein
MRIVLFLSSVDIEVGSTFDNWSSVIPRHVVRKPSTIVMSETAEALSPWYRINEVIKVAEEK